MAYYSVATTKDKLSSLIDKALAGEEVVITRHGKPTVSLNMIRTDHAPKLTKEEAWERLRVLRESLPMSSVSYLDLKRMDEEDGAL